MFYRSLRRSLHVSMALAAMLSSALADTTGTTKTPAFTGPPLSDEHMAAALEALPAQAKDLMARTGLPGLAIAVVHQGETLFAQGFGHRRIDDSKPVDADTVFQLASLSKPVGATVVARQVDRGTIGWDSPVQSHLPGFALSDPWVSQHVTVGDLYAHRSGLPDHAGDLLEDMGYDRATVLSRLPLLPLSDFRNHYAYTNFGLTAAAEAVAKSAGMGWADLAQQVLFDPLAMASTSARHAEFMARDNRAVGHIKGKDGAFVISDLRQPDAQSPAGGMSSSVHDMARWMSMVLSGGMVAGAQFISEDALIPALTPQITRSRLQNLDALPESYGFGFNTAVQPSGRMMVSHSGAFVLGASTHVAMIPALELGIVVLTNGPPIGVAETIGISFLDQVQYGRERRDWFALLNPLLDGLNAPIGALVGETPPANPGSSRAAQSYMGRYENPYFGAAEVFEQDGALVMTLGPKGQIHPLEHWDGDVFILRPFTENAPTGSISQVRFGGFDAMLARKLTVEHLNDLGMGVFVR